MTDPAERRGAELLMAVVAAERTVPFTAHERVVHGVPGRHRETALRVRRFAGGRTLVNLEPHSAATSAEEPEAPGSGLAHDARFAWIDDPSALLANYRVVAEYDAPQVAWRPTVRLDVTARRPGRPSLELLVDAETHVVLREVFRDPSGEVRLTSTYGSIAYGDPESLPSDDAYAPLSGAPSAPAAVQPDFAALVADHVPTGFSHVSRRDDASGRVEHFSDGLSAYLVRQWPAADGGVEPGTLTHSVHQGRETFVGVFEGVGVEVTGYLGREDLEAVVRGLRLPVR